MCDKKEENMAHITNKLRGLVAAFVAVFAALALVPGTAFAATPTAEQNSDSVTISGLQDTDQVWIYKVVDTTVNGDRTLSFAWNQTNIGTVSLNDNNLSINNYVNGNDDKIGDGDVAAAIRAALNKKVDAKEAAPVNANALTPTDGVVTQGNLDYGQYMVIIKTAEGSLRTYQNLIFTVQPFDENGDGLWDEMFTTPQQIAPKYNETVKPGKIINDRDQGKTSDKYFPGDEVSYKITVKVPSYADNTDWNTLNFMITDTRSKLDKPSSYTVNVTGEQTAVAPGNDTYTIDDTTDTTKTVFNFNSDWIKSHQGETITISYTTKVSTDAGHVNPATNTVEVNPGHGADAGSDSTMITLYGLKVTKTNENGSKKLQGAEFDLYFDANGNDKVDEGEKKLNNDPLKTDNQGVVECDGLRSGHYVLVETKAPAGYETTTKPFEITSESVKDGVYEVTVYDQLQQGVNLPTSA